MGQTRIIDTALISVLFYSSPTAEIAKTAKFLGFLCASSAKVIVVCDAGRWCHLSLAREVLANGGVAIILQLPLALLSKIGSKPCRPICLSCCFLGRSKGESIF
jgi:hypothetical protein